MIQLLFILKISDSAVMLINLSQLKNKTGIIDIPYVKHKILHGK